MSTLTLKRRTPSLGALPSVTPSPSLSTMPPIGNNKTPPPGASLYHTCRLVLDKLALVEGMSYWLDMEDNSLSPSLSPISTSSPPLMPLSTSSSPSMMPASTTSDTQLNDPLSKLCYLCRRGTPLFTLFNALGTNQPLKTDPNPKLNLVNNCKANVYHFLVACRQQLLFPEEELFTVSDLYVDDTNGFVKVVNTIHKILQLLEDKGIISSESNHNTCPVVPPKDTRDKVVLELLATERKYVQDLETLQNYMRELQQQRILSQDTVHYLFGNLNALVDFQRRFLFQMEKTAENDPKDQHFGLLFSQLEGAFSVYEPYCSNFYSAQDLVVQEAPNLQKLSDITNPTYEITSLLIKPIQRICKYPLLLSELLKSTDKDWPTIAEMVEGLESMRRVADKVNETQRKHENVRMVGQLKHRVNDWKGILVDKCGQLLLQDKMLVSAYETEREMYVFFFEHQLLLFKEAKDNSKARLAKANTISIKKRRRGTLEPRGKIETTTITCIQNISKNAEWALLIEWSEQETGQFTLKFRNDEQHKLWESTLKKQIKARKNQSAMSSSMTDSSLPAADMNNMSDAMASILSLQENTDSWSFIDPDDEEDEVDYMEADTDDTGSGSRSRSNSFSAHLLNTFSTRPKFGRNNSSDISASKPVTASAMTTPFMGRSNTPGLTLQPLPRSTCSASIHHQRQQLHQLHHHHHQQQQQQHHHHQHCEHQQGQVSLQFSGDYSFYPSSPPPSNPSSPTSSSRVSPNSSASGRSLKDPSLHHHHQQQQQQRQKGFTILPTPYEPVTPSTDYFATPTANEFDVSVGYPGPSHSEKCAQNHRHHTVQPHARSRAQSSPSVETSQRRQDSNDGLLTKSTTWEQYPTATLHHCHQQHYPHQAYYQREQQHQQHQQMEPTLQASTPRLSDRETSASLQSHMDRALSVVANSISPGQLKVKLIYNGGKYSIIIPQQISYVELVERVELKLQAVSDVVPGDTIRMKYRDEEGDFITINSDDDILMAFETEWQWNIVLYVSL